MKIPVVRMFTTGDQNTDFVEIDIEQDVNFIFRWRKTKHSAEVLAYHTSNGSFLSLNTMHEAAISFEKYGFKYFDASTIVNLKRVSETIPMENGSKVVFVDGNFTIVRSKHI
ncbi:LytTR family transcriptional regulator DNA-binding domain-containing protein [Paenibacillus apii]|uniref:LytTR family transcriptional regulator DNA-binding domain-containing protein n=1 Tax=Paenibacillus apii TaxID=1850370 RepID=UPI00143B734E|nr:LytTR family transcriptional regulator DNA-binding domain-containing protein [Paenibacillus apii]NJJ38586.1 hypothetical protein [Paenibacillus apii]